MNKFFLYFCLIIIFSCTDNENNNQNNLIVNSIKKVSPSVVGINTKSINNKGYYGSGLIISKEGYIITNSHVVEYSKEIIITASGGKKYYAEVIGTDDLTDIALLRIEGTDLTVANLVDSIELVQGEWVIAIGNPNDYFANSHKATATIGIISGKNINFGIDKSGHVYQDMIQTDASINPGNSGGPLVNLSGEVIAINTFISSGEFGFSIPIDRVIDIIKVLKIHGKVDRKWITGITVREIDERYKNYLKIEADNGVIVSDVEKKSSGEEAGILLKDVITMVDGKKVNSVKDIEDILDKGYFKTGDQVDILVIRNNEPVQLKLNLINPYNKKEGR